MPVRPHRYNVAVVVPEHLCGTGRGEQEGVALGAPAVMVALALDSRAE